MKTLTIIDTFGFLFRSYYALPPLKSSKGFPTGLLTGFMNFVSNIGKDFQTDYLVFALDSKGDTFRHEIYSEYKSHRPDVPEDLLRQLPIAIDWIEKMGFCTAAKVGYEADDIIASLAHDAKDKGLEVRIVSHDKDLYQLIGEGVYLFDPIKKNKITEKECYDKYGVWPKQFIDYQSLLGDSADNVPGVKGVGAKTAEALIQQFGSLDNIYQNIDNIEKKRWQTLLNESKEMAFISKQLVTLHNDAHAIDDVERLTLPKDNPILKISDTLLEYDMNRIIQKVHKDGLNYKTNIPVSKSSVEYEYILLDTKDKLFKVLNSIPSDAIVALDTETTDLDATKANIVGFSFSFDTKKGFYVPIGHYYLGVGEQLSLDDAKEAIEKLSKFKLLFQNFKYDSEIIKNNFGIALELYADTMILGWLNDPESSVSLDNMSKRFFNHEMISYKDTVQKGENFSNVDIEKACKYASEDALITYKLYFKLSEELKKKSCSHLIDLASKVEFPFTNTLIYMEANGIKIDIDFFKSLQEKSAHKLQELTRDIFEQSGSEFNINSTKQLGVVLFETLGLPTGKKTKTGYSTNEAVLQGLKDAHPVIPLLLEYREMHKLKSTYIDPLLELGSKVEDNRIHTSFLQTGTATGRLSSKNPNLQNIPVKTEAGREIRGGFVAKDGKKLIGIDYSQIELRLLAHYSKDPALVEAFNKGLDIHTQTAVKIFGEEEAPAKRNIAKSINFGLLYGMGSRKLGDTLGIPAKEAKGYIESYFEAFATVKDFLKSIEDYALEHGFVETLLRRRRYFDFDNANGMQRPMFLREAVNTVFQGSAADLIKLSMVEIYKKYKDSSEVKMLLQIHDELIFEVDEDKAETIAQELKAIMQNIYTLEIPLEVSVSVGKNWGELK